MSPTSESLRPQERGTKKVVGERKGGTLRESQIEHRIFNLASGTTVPQPLRLPERSQLLFLLTRRSACGSRTTIRYALQKRVQIRAPTFACKISIVRWGGERDGFGCTSEHVRDRVGETLELVRLEPDVIVDDVIVRRTDCALKTVVRLEEEIKICAGCPLALCQCRSCPKERSP